jgi:ABC-type multidrug transport system permease subunit
MVPGATFPDYELPDHTSTPRRLSELQGANPLILAVAELFHRPESSTVALAAMSLSAIMMFGISFPLEVQAGWMRALSAVLSSTFGIQGFLQLAEMGARFVQR